jgi:hypothetical protein
MTRPGIDIIDAALIALLQEATALDYIPDNQVQESDQGINFDTMEIIVAPPAILIAYDGGQYSSANHDNSAYRIDERFTLIAVAENLRGFASAQQGGPGDEKGVYGTLEDLKSVIVENRRLTIDTLTNTRISLVLLGTILFENLFYQSGFAAIGLQIQVTGASWDYANA